MSNRLRIITFAYLCYPNIAIKENVHVHYFEFKVESKISHYRQRIESTCSKYYIHITKNFRKSNFMGYI